MPTSIPVCLDCKHYIRGKKCDAFLGDIPDSIFLGDIDHKNPVEGDNGIQFEPFERELDIEEELLFDDDAFVEPDL
jgi:hypothetical protein